MKRFPSIKKNTDFRAAYALKKSKAADTMAVYIRSNGTDGNRLGVSVSKKTGNSVVRHTVTRKMREIFRKNNDSAVQGYDIVIVIRNRGAAASYGELEKDYLKLLRDHKLLSGSK